ncbi:MAG: hypothetical protein QW828_05790 [Candidatus Bathyarchaeia archaeon]
MKFDKIAKTSGATSSSSSRKVANVSDAVKAAVDVFIALKAHLAQLKSELESNQKTIVDNVWPQYEELARKGQFTKSLDVPGNTGKVTFVQSDNWSIPQDEATLKMLKDLLGEALYDRLFTVKRTISIKKSVLEDEKLLNRIATACEKAGMDIGDVFDVGDKVVATPDLDRRQFEEVPREKFAEFRSLVHQYSPSLK